MGKEERKRENKLREAKTVQVEKEQSRTERELLGHIRSSDPHTSSHRHPVLHCQLGSHQPRQEEEQAWRDEGACPACAHRQGRQREVGGGGSGAEKREVSRMVQETATEREGLLLHVALHPCPSTSSSEAMRDLRVWSMVRSSSSNCLTRLGWKRGTPRWGQQRTGSRMCLLLAGQHPPAPGL